MRARDPRSRLVLGARRDSDDTCCIKSVRDEAEGGDGVCSIEGRNSIFLVEITSIFKEGFSEVGDLRDAATTLYEKAAYSLDDSFLVLDGDTHEVGNVSKREVGISDVAPVTMGVTEVVGRRMNACHTQKPQVRKDIIIGYQKMVLLSGLTYTAIGRQRTDVSDGMRLGGCGKKPPRGHADRLAV